MMYRTDKNGILTSHLEVKYLICYLFSL